MSVQPSTHIHMCLARSGFSILLASLLLVSLSANAQIPASQHIVLVIDENHSLAEVQAGMPWLVAQGTANGYAINYKSDTDGSLEDYLWLASGWCENTGDCSVPPGYTTNFACNGGGCTPARITDDNIFREMNNAGISWKVYAETYTQAGGTPTSPDNNTIHYYRRHNGATWYSDILDNLDGSASKIVDFSQFASDLAVDALPRFVIIVPNGLDDAHDGTLAQADSFLKNNLTSMLSKPYFQAGGDGLLLVTFDECNSGNNTGCSNSIYTAIIGPKVIPSTVSSVAYKHENLLRTMLDALGITTYPGWSASAAPMSDFFNGSPASNVLLADDFNSTSIDNAKWSPTLFTGAQNTSVAVSDNGTQLQIGPLPTNNATSSSYNGITSKISYDFSRGGDAYVQLVQPAAAGSNAFTMFAVGTDSSNFYRFYVSGGNLVCEQKIGGAKSEVGSVAYDAVAHQFLRLSYDANTGNVVWETAPNNNGSPGSWTQRCSELWNTTAVPLNSVKFEMKAGTSVPESTAPGTILFDNFRAEKPALLTDNFNSAPLDTTKWSHTVFTGTQDTSIQVIDTGAQLQIGPLPTNASSSSYNGITSLRSYDFSGAYAYVQLVQPAASNSNAFTMFAVGKDSSNFYRFYVSAGSLVCEQKIGGTKGEVGSTAYNGTTQQFLRIRHDATTGNVVWETAPNNSGTPGTFTQQCSEPWNTTAVPLRTVLFEMKAGTGVPEPNPPGTVIFDNFNAAKQ